MKNTSNQSYKALSIPHFKEVFEIIDMVMNEHQTPYYLIGVNAIALELLKQGIQPSRGTKDIDFAIMVSSITEYQELSSALVDKGFNKVEAPWTFYSKKYNVVVDILPFGIIEQKNTVQFSKRYTDLHVLGFKEVLAHPTKIQIEETFVNIPPLSGMIILKLVAWSDRPEERTNDLADILKIIEYYFDYNFDEIVEHYNDTFPEEGFDQLLIAAEVLGRKAKFFLTKSTALSDRVYTIISENLNEESQSKIARKWAQIKDWEIQYALSVLKCFQKGITKN